MYITSRFSQICSFQNNQFTWTGSTESWSSNWWRPWTVVRFVHWTIVAPVGSSTQTRLIWMHRNEGDLAIVTDQQIEACKKKREKIGDKPDLVKDTGCDSD